MRERYFCPRGRSKNVKININPQLKMETAKIGYVKIVDIQV